MEVWKPVKDFEGYYEVSDLGRVRSIDRVIYDNVRKCNRLLKGRLLVQRDNGHGYKGVMLCKEHKLYNRYVHILVAETFLENPLKLPTVNHKDEDKGNNVLPIWSGVHSITTTNMGPGRRGGMKQESGMVV